MSNISAQYAKVAAAVLLCAGHFQVVRRARYLGRLLRLALGDRFDDNWVVALSGTVYKSDRGGEIITDLKEDIVPLSSGKELDVPVTVYLVL
jgi:hypothetical protein